MVSWPFFYICSVWLWYTDERISSWSILQELYRVGLEQTFFREMENVGVIELCVIVFEPDLECPIKFPFQVQLYTIERSAGKYSI